MTTTALTDIAACTLDAGGASRRATELRALLGPRLRRLVREGDTATLELEMGARAEREARELLRRERECCPFWRFALERRSPRRVRLTATATPPFGDALDALLSLVRPAGAGEEEALRAGEAAVRAGVGIETLRYYERRGLLPAPRRRPSGQRQYAPGDIRRVRAIKAAQRLGFTLEEIRGMVAPTTGPAGRGPLRDLADAKLAEVHDRIRGLERVRGELEAVVAAGCDRLIGCGCGDCPVEDAVTSPPGRARGGGPV